MFKKPLFQCSSFKVILKSSLFGVIIGTIGDLKHSNIFIGFLIAGNQLANIL